MRLDIGWVCMNTDMVLVLYPPFVVRPPPALAKAPALRTPLVFLGVHRTERVMLAAGATGFVLVPSDHVLESSAPTAISPIPASVIIAHLPDLLATPERYLVIQIIRVLFLFPIVIQRHG